jgi:hypothetical protein
MKLIDLTIINYNSKPYLNNIYVTIKHDGITKGYFVFFAFSKDAETEV